MELFEESFRSEFTKNAYKVYLRKYGLDKLSITKPNLVESELIKFILKMKKDGKQSTAIENYVKPVILYYKLNDVMLNTKKINRFIPGKRRIKKDRAYTHAEISKMLDIADERMKTVLLLLCSSGIRIGTVPDIRLHNLEDKKLTVYENTKEEYFTFITQECKKAIDSYLNMRERYGEKLTNNSILIREQFDIRDTHQIKKARQISTDAIRWMIVDISKRCGVRSTVVPIAHGFRKFFTTQLIQSKVNPEIREMLLGHKIGLASAYYRPTEDEMYLEYEKALDNLTINEENRLRRKVETLTIEKSRLDRIEEKMLKMEQMYKK
jgi:integrase/recombinase XerD